MEKQMMGYPVRTSRRPSWFAPPLNQREEILDSNLATNTAKRRCSRLTHVDVGILKSCYQTIYSRLTHADVEIPNVTPGAELQVGNIFD